MKSKRDLTEKKKEKKIIKCINLRRFEQIGIIQSFIKVRLIINVLFFVNVTDCCVPGIGIIIFIYYIQIMCFYPFTFQCKNVRFSHFYSTYYLMLLLLFYKSFNLNKTYQYNMLTYHNVYQREFFLMKKKKNIKPSNITIKIKIIIISFYYCRLHNKPINII